MRGNPYISLSICGHAWHGKSTLLGKIVAESGMASPREIENARRQAKEGRDPSLVFAQLVFRSKDISHGESEAARDQRGRALEPSELARVARPLR